MFEDLENSLRDLQLKSEENETNIEILHADIQDLQDELAGEINTLNNTLQQLAAEMDNLRNEL